MTERFNNRAGFTVPTKYLSMQGTEREVSGKFTWDFVFPIFKHCLLNYLCLVFVKSATMDGPETPVFNLCVEKDTRVVALPVLETLLLMFFKPGPLPHSPRPASEPGWCLFIYRDKSLVMILGLSTHQ